MFRGLAFSVLLLTAGSLHAQVPHTVQAGQPARAAEVNQNFQSLWQGVAGSIGMITVVGRVAESGTGIAAAQCPTDTVPISASCSCDYVNGTRNFGVLFGCTVVGDGAAAGCYHHLPDFSLPPPLAIVRVECLGGQTNDGTPLTRVFGMEIKAQSDELGEALNRFQKQADDYRVRLDR